MPTFWRITKERYADTAFDGEGARRFGGRWNSPGAAVVYASESRALALLEVLAGVGDAGLLGSYVLIPAEVGDRFLESVDPTDLDPAWARQPPGPASQAVGDAWLRAATSAALKVPSVLVPGEFNVVLNPAHADFGSIAVGEPIALAVDARLYR
ncbi:MAG: RES family NAD+ phosphorylase [Gemmatimonadota bacterium]